MKHYTLTVFLGSTILRHESETMFGIVNALRDIALKCPEYAELLEPGAIDEYIEDLVLLKNNPEDFSISNATPYIKIRYEEACSCPPTLPDCNTEKEASPWQK